MFADFLKRTVASYFIDKVLLLALAFIDIVRYATNIAFVVVFSCFEYSALISYFGDGCGRGLSFCLE